MIVVDTNLIAYAVLPGERTKAALALAERVVPLEDLPLAR